MITFLLLVVFLITMALIHFYKVFQAYDFSSNKLKLNFKFIAIFIGGIIAIIIQPFSYERIDSGSVGLIENLVGDKRGIDGVSRTSGYQMYNIYTQKIHEIENDIKNVHYPPMDVILKGGFVCRIKPTFNYRVKEATTPELFVALRQTIKNGGLEAIEKSWMETAILGAINDVSNRYQVDSIFNYRESYEKQIEIEVQKRVKKYFEISGFKSNIVPPGSLVESIQKKTKAVQEAAAIELVKITTQKTAENDRIAAEGRLKVAQIDAEAKKVLSTPQQLEYYEAETRRIRAEKGTSQYGANNVFGTMPSLLLNRK